MCCETINSETLATSAINKLPYCFDRHKGTFYLILIVMEISAYCNSFQVNTNITCNILDGITLAKSMF